ncbi:MAG: PAS domain S-box protein [Magnetococcales bacterium]|nr:PAS domain S-box protein [Magnetococcales bacterium]
MALGKREETAHILLLVLIMALVGLIMSGISIAILYEVSFDQTKQRLEETVQSRARLMEAIARQEAVHLGEHGVSSMQQVVEATMAQIRDAHHHFMGFGETGEFTMGRLEGKNIIFVLRQRHADIDQPLPVPPESRLAEPMRAALAGRSGVLIGQDYRNQTVLAAYEPVRELEMGMVAKIDMDEIRRPFIQAGGMVFAVGVVVIGLGTLLFYKISNPMVQQLMETAALRESRERLVKTQASLQKNTAYLDNILRTATDLAIIATDQTFCIRYFNPEAEKLFDRRAESVLNHHIEKIHTWTEIHENPLTEAIQSVMERGEHSFEIRINRDGKERTMEARLSSILDRDNTLTGFLLMAKDVTQANQAKETFLRTQRKYRLLIESANDAIFIADAQTGIITEANLMAGELLGCPVHEVIGMHQTELHPPEERERYRSLFEENVRKGRGLLTGITVLRKDGGRVPVEIRAGVTDLGDGKVIQGIFRDVSERINFEHSLEEERRKFQATFEQAAVGIAHVAIDGTFLLLNNRFGEITGYPRAEMATKSFQEMTHPDDLETGLKCARRMLNGEISRYSLEKRCLHKLGHPIWVLLTVSLLTNQEGEPQFFVAVIEDISERKRLEEHLQATNLTLEHRVAERTQELERSNQDLQQFAYVASHDLQEPLRLIAGYVQLLEKRYRGQLDAQADKYIAYAVDGVGHMQTLINNLLTYARTGTRDKAFEETDANLSLERAIANLAQRIDDTGAEITSTPLPKLYADPVQLTQLFQNLLGNALKFRSEETPKVQIHAKRGPGHWIFTVQDNGIGIEAHHQERIFLIFQKLHSRTRYEGTGIGLALCKRIVELHKGKIWVESKPGQGSAFHFFIPDANPSAFNSN